MFQDSQNIPIKRQYKTRSDTSTPHHHGRPVATSWSWRHGVVDRSDGGGIAQNRITPAWRRHSSNLEFGRCRFRFDRTVTRENLFRAAFDGEFLNLEQKIWNAGLIILFVETHFSTKLRPYLQNIKVEVCLIANFEKTMLI